MHFCIRSTPEEILAQKEHVSRVLPLEHMLNRSLVSSTRVTSQSRRYGLSILVGNGLPLFLFLKMRKKE